MIYVLHNVTRSLQWKLPALYFCILATITTIQGSPIDHKTSEPVAFEKHNQLFGFHECSWGPSFWCYNIINAKRCNAVTYCIKNVWQKSAVPNDQSAVCEVCLDTVNKAREELHRNVNTENMKALFAVSCESISNRLIAKQCHHLMDNFFPELVDTLKSHMHTQAVCTVAGLCNNPANDRLFEQQFAINAPASKDPTPIITPTTNALIVQQLLENGRYCQVCVYVIGYAKTALSDKSVDTYIETGFKLLCDFVPPGINAVCIGLVSVYGDTLIAWVLSEIDPTQFCTAVTLCSPDGNDDVEEIFDLPFAIGEDSCHRAVGDKCAFCLLTVGQLQAELKRSDESVKAVQYALNHLCHNLPIGKRLECTDTLVAYSSKIMTNNFSTKQICNKLKLCDEKKRHKHKNLEPMINEPNIKINEIPLLVSSMVNYLDQDCLLCEKVIKNLKRHIENKQTKVGLKQIFASTCTKLTKFEHQCSNLVEQYFDQAVHHIMRELQPKAICRYLRMCPSKINIAKAQSDDNPEVEPEFQSIVNEVSSKIQTFLQGSKKGLSDDPPICSFCQEVITQLAEELQKETTAITDMLKHFCHWLKNYEKDCDNIIDEYAGMIINLLASIPPKEICSDIFLCTSLQSNESKLKVLDCAVCHAAAQELTDQLKNTKFDESIEQIVDEKICSQLPVKFVDRCVKLIQIYGYSIVNIITRGDELDTICIEIGMCLTTDEFPSLVHFA